MPALPNVAQVMRVALKYTLGGDVDVLNRMFFQYDGTAPSISDVDSWCAALGTIWNTHVASLVNNTVSLTEISSEDLTSPTSASGTASMFHSGTSDSGALNAGTALVMSGKITRRYRGGHPRLYFPYFGSSDLDTPQTWLADALSAMQTAWDTFIADTLESSLGSASIVGPVNISYFEGFTNFTFPSGRTKAIPKLRVTPLIDPIVSYSPNPAPASQRRRNLTP